MWRSPFSPEARRRRLLRKAPPGPLHDFLSVPFPDPRQSVFQSPIFSLDFETTGLDPRRDHLLSAGGVEIRHGRVELATAWHRWIRSRRPLSDANVALHQITEQQAARGVPLDKVMEELLRRLAGKVLLAHHARMETGFLQAACRTLWGLPPPFLVIDTLQLARRTLERRNQPLKAGTLRLFNLRAAAGLPRYRAHNALCDAIAAAELFLVQVEQAAGGREPPLGRFLS